MEAVGISKAGAATSRSDGVTTSSAASDRRANRFRQSSPGRSVCRV
jgi:hypothetical protein